MNVLKTGILMGLLTILLVGVGQLVGGLSGMMFFLVLAVIMNFAAYWWSDKLALKMARAHPVSEEEAPELHRLVERVGLKLNMPKPRVYIVHNESPNAFATGRNPKHAAIAVTTGITKLLNEEELEGVLAHEYSHIRNRDILIMAIAATMAGVLTMIAFWMRFSAIFGGMGGRDRNNGMAGMMMLLILSILIPIAAMIIKLAISRSREYHADETGAKMIGNPLALASALEKLEAGARSKPMRVNEGVSHLFIVNPLRGSSLASLFSTHPPVQERVRRLQSMARISSI